MSLTPIWTNDAKATLASPVTTGATTVTLNSGQGALFPDPNSSQFFPVTLVSAANNSVYEICYCTARATDVLTVERAQEGTIATAFATSDIASHQLTAGTIPSPAGSGYPTAITAVSSSGTISAALFGQTVEVGGSATTQTIAGTGWATGNTIGFYASAACTVATTGGPTFAGTGLFAGTTSVAMPIGTAFMAQFDGTSWVVLFASQQLGNPLVASITDVTGSRALGTTYTNTTGKIMYVAIWGKGTTTNSDLSMYIQGVQVTEQQAPASGISTSVYGMVFPGWTYGGFATLGGITLQKWNETVWSGTA